MKSAPTKLVRRRGWVAVQKADVALLVEQSGESAATTCMTWIALLIIANDRRASVFKVGINVIRHLAGPSLRTVKTGLKRLADLGFIKMEANRVPDSKERDANTYVLLRGGKIDARSANNCTTGRANDDVLRLHGSSEESASACQESASAPEELGTAGLAASAAASQPSSRNGNTAPRKW